MMRPAVDCGGVPVFPGAPPVSRPGRFSCSRHGWSFETDVTRLSARRSAWCYRGGSISAEPRINDRIRVPEVRLVGPSGEQVGIVPLAKALELAQEYDLDLVEVAATARPPCASSWTTGSSSTSRP
ncbi:translation initiation factor IF-3 [Streptomyces fulvorobeus]|uniref:translation initiation factor IF-3 n=1 Tax=Streptomyces fulvorobeus TaxID=284028 RepID=UPI0035312B42